MSVVEQNDAQHRAFLTANSDPKNRPKFGPPLRIRRPYDTEPEPSKHGWAEILGAGAPRREIDEVPDA